MNFQTFLNENSSLVTIISVIVILCFFALYLIRLLIAKGDNQKLKNNRILPIAG